MILQKMINASREVSSMLVQNIKKCWFKRPKDARGDLSFIDRAFWAETEQDYFNLLEKSSQYLGQEVDLLVVNHEIMESWRRSLKNTALRLFSQWAESSNIEHEDPKRIALAYNELMGRLNGPKLREKILDSQARKENLEQEIAT